MTAHNSSGIVQFYPPPPTHTHTTHTPTSHTHTLTGDAEEAELPYFEVLPIDPSFDDVKKVVVVDKRRPAFPNRWSGSGVSGRGCIALLLLPFSKDLNTILYRSSIHQ